MQKLKMNVETAIQELINYCMHMNSIVKNLHSEEINNRQIELYKMREDIFVLLDEAIENEDINFLWTDLINAAVRLAIEILENHRKL